MLEAPKKPKKADYLVVESTYGDRLHPKIDNEKQFIDILQKVSERNGILIVPSFTVDRAQDFMYLFWKLEQKKDIPNIPIYLDSPMGTDVSKVFNKYYQWHKLGADVFSKVFENTKMVRSYKDTEQLAGDSRPKIVIAGSGMMNGGRVLTYLKRHIGNPESTIIIPGYQAEGTRGRSIHDGADQGQIIQWLSGLEKRPECIFINHGESKSSNALRVKIQDTLGCRVIIPQLQDEFPLS